MKMGVIHQWILVFQKGEDGLISKTTRKQEIIKALGGEKSFIVVYNCDGVKSETESRSPAGPALLIAELGVGAEGRMRLIVTLTFCK